MNDGFNRDEITDELLSHFELCTPPLTPAVVLDPFWALASAASQLRS